MSKKRRKPKTRAAAPAEVMIMDQRATTVPNDPGIATSDPRIQQLFGILGMQSASGVSVTEEKALGVPAVWSAVNFIPGTLAGLPLMVYRRRKDVRERVSGSIHKLLHDAANDEMSSFDWRKYTFERVMTGGRAFTYIERDSRDQPINLWPLNPEGVTVKRENLRTRYEYSDGSGTKKVYEAWEMIDLPFSLAADGVRHRGPIASNKDVIGLAIAATQYGSKFFQGGGVPPFAVTGGFQSPGAMARATSDLEEAVRTAAKEERQALILPNGLEIKPIGVEPEKSQLVELKRFIIEEIARIYSLPPVFLQDLTHGTFSNTEQQDLHFVKHTLKRWAEQFEQELNLKLFGRENRSGRYAELNMDGLLRGDFKTRMEGNALAIQTGQLMPNEAREHENRPPRPGGDRLYVQGAMIPAETAGQQQEPDGGDDAE